MLPRRSVLIVSAFFALFSAVPVCMAQQWPDHTVKVVVPYGAGGVTDVMARITADRLGKILKSNIYRRG